MTGKQKKSTDADLDEALEQSFPTSDPPSQTNPSQSTKTDGARLDRHAKRQDEAADKK